MDNTVDGCPGVVTDNHIRTVGAFIATSFVSFLSFECSIPVFMASLGASIVILFAMPNSDAARPRTVLIGHALSATIGVLSVSVFGICWYAASIAVAVSMTLMLLLKSLHPPGGATALIAVTTGASWDFVMAPVLLGAISLVGVFILTEYVVRVRNRACEDRKVTD